MASQNRARCCEACLSQKQARAAHKSVSDILPRNASRPPAYSGTVWTMQGDPEVTSTAHWGACSVDGVCFFSIHLIWRKHRMDKTLSNLIARPGTLVVATLVLTIGAAGRAIAAPNAPAAGPLDDAQIVDRVLAFERAEVRTADVVKGKLFSAPEWQLAQRMTVDDTALEQKFGPLAAAKQQQPGNDGAADGQADGVDLSKLSGDALEKAYVDREVKSHEAMLTALDGQLIPSAKSEDLQRLLIDLRADTAAQLEHAQNVQHREKVRETFAEPDPYPQL
jgi:putative membrane protein